MLLKAVSQEQVEELTMVGSLLALSRMGPELSIQSIARNVGVIMRQIEAIEKRQAIGTQSKVAVKAR